MLKYGPGKVLKVQDNFEAIALSTNPTRLRCLFFAKLLAILVAHWLMALDDRTFPERSLWQAAQVVRAFAFSLLDALLSLDRLDTLFLRLRSTLARACRLSKRKAHPLTFQRLA